MKIPESRMLRRIRQEGERTVLRSAILRCLRARFLVEPPQEFASALDQMDDIGRLESLLDLVVTCGSIDEINKVHNGKSPWPTRDR